MLHALLAVSAAQMDTANSKTAHHACEIGPIPRTQRIANVCNTFGHTESTSLSFIKIPSK